MSNVQMTDCKAMEAQSLEQARRAADPDLRHLYETIAGQWHLLAEVGQMRHLNAALGCPPNGRGVLISGRAGSVDQGPESLDDQRPNTDSGIAQVSADPGPESLGEQQPLNIEGVIAQFPETNQAAQVGVDRETESLDDQRPDTDSGIAQVSTDPGPDEQQPLNIEPTLQLSADPAPEGVIAQFPETNQAAQVGMDRETESLDDQRPDTDSSIAQVSTDPRPESLDEQQPLSIEPAPQLSADPSPEGAIAQFPETNQAAQVGMDRETETLDGQHPDTDSGIAQVSTDPKTNQASKVGADRGTERLDGSASGTDGSKPSERRIESPLEWILSYWFKGHHH